MDGTRARLVRARLESELEPAQALLAVRSERRPFALAGSWAGGGAIVGCDPLFVPAADADPFALLDRQPRVDADEPAVGGGWFGYLGYQAGAPGPPPPRPLPAPRSSLAYYDHVLHRDPSGAWWFEALATPATEVRIAGRLDALRRRLAAPAPARSSFECGPFTPRPGREGFGRAVDDCIERIHAGDLYQANLTLRLEARLRGRAVDLFADCLASLRPSYGAYIGDPRLEVASMSPELFLRRRGRSVSSAPIKGTSRRDDDPATAASQRRALEASAKDRAENVMIVDLVRNDLGRVCEFGSVGVEAAARAERHPGLWHLTSTVSGTLRSEAGDADLLRAAFPPGSVTGAPKIMAMGVISTLEGTAREAYTGAIGYASPFAGLELNVAIRTFEASGDRIWLGAGGGIVADSDPDAEFEEALDKAQPLVAAAGSKIAAATTVRRRPAPAAARRLRRPDPAMGIFETLLVVDGEPVDADRHLARLRSSARSLYGQAPNPGDVERRIADALDGAAARSRLRVSVRPGPNGLDLTADAEPVAEREGGPVRLAPATIAGGLGEHKWCDRGFLARLRTAGAETLILDLDGAVLETERGNVWAVADGAVATPPADGRILPGVTRSTVIDLCRELGLPSRVEELGLASLADADEVFLTSSIRGIAAACIDADAARPSGLVSSLLAEALLTRIGAAEAGAGPKLGEARGERRDHARVTR